MRLLTLNGSPAGPTSANGRLLAALAAIAPEHDWRVAPDVGALPLFTPAALAAGRPAEVEVLAQAIAAADAVVVSAPEYAHNLPAALKSALEWMVASGELAGKPVVAMTATPAPPRGEHCMRSLVATLLAMDARVLAKVPVYGVAEKLGEGGAVVDRELTEVLGAVVGVIAG